MKLSIVIPIFNERASLPELYRRVRAVLDGLPELEHRVIYVNDGSTDGSLELMLDQQREDPRFTVVDLSRNFGQQFDFGIAWLPTHHLLFYGTYLRFWAGQFYRDTQTAPPANMNGVMVLTQVNF